MRTIKAKHTAVYAPIADLETYRAMPTHSIEHLDPFLFINHHGPQVYGPNNNGLPFGPHPHRGFETLTYVLEGDIMHWDSSGSKSVITKGGVQWMTAGSGLIHSEISSDKFKKEGGKEEVIQLWMNLRAKDKLVSPSYNGLEKEDIIHFELNNGQVEVHLISGRWGEHEGPHKSISGLTMSSVEMKAGGQLLWDVPKAHQVLFYVVKGVVQVNGIEAQAHELITFDFDHNDVQIEASSDSVLILGHGEPFNEPIVAHGPFVMNTQEEIHQAFTDYQSGKMGSW